MSSSSSKVMTLNGHLEELRSRIINVVIPLVVISIFCMSFTVNSTALDYNGNDSITFYYPYPNPLNNLATQTLKFMQETLLPQGVELIQTAPGQAFFSQIQIALLIGVIGSMPILIKEAYEFISPGLGYNTRTGMFNVFFPAVSLFVIGFVFSYILVLPFTLNFLYAYGESMGVATFLNINDFLSFSALFFLAFGISFQLPIVMYTISSLGLVDAQFWKDKFKYAVLIMIIFSALVTPDGSGITMWFIVLPMLLLYISGTYIIVRRERKYVISIT